MANSTAIGIDLGTTNTLAAVYVNGKPEIIPNKLGHPLTPSLVFYDPETLEASVGKVAENLSIGCPKNYMFDMKRIIGRSYHDIYVQNFVKMKESQQFSIEIVNSTNESADETLVKLEGSDKSSNIYKSPEDVSSEILKYIKESVTDYLGFDVKDAVISVPAYFSYAQRAATKRAAEMVGFKVLKLITEPVAAAIHYTFKKPKLEEKLLMFDLGGGTLDVCVISLTNENISVKSIEGDMFLGGRDFDQVIFDYLRVEIGTKYGHNFISDDTTKGKRLLLRLRKNAIQYKKMLSNVDKYSMILELDSETECKMTITREEFEKLSEELFQKIINKVKQCLKSANMSKEDIDRVVLVGGSSRIPKVRAILQDLFSHIKLSTDINPDEAVALGASIHAALLKNEIENIERYHIVEVAPFSVGVLAKYNLMVDFITKGTALPASTSQIMHTTDNDQLSVEFEIFEGERKNCKYNNRLGGFSINHLPPGKPGDFDLIVTFYLDENGLLRVTALEMITGTEKQLQIEMANLTLCSSNNFKSILEEDRQIKEDIDYEKLCRLKLEAETYCKGLLYDLEHANVTVGPIIERECISFLRTMDTFEINGLELAFEKLKTRLQTIWHRSSRSQDVEVCHYLNQVRL